MNFGLSVAAGAFFTSTPFDIVGGGSERILVHVRCHLVRSLCYTRVGCGTALLL
jgi:hypothetical protein